MWTRYLLACKDGKCLQAFVLVFFHAAPKSLYRNLQMLPHLLKIYFVVLKLDLFWIFILIKWKIHKLNKEGENQEVKQNTPEKMDFMEERQENVVVWTIFEKTLRSDQIHLVTVAPEIP